jgi:hypothetical protein
MTLNILVLVTHTKYDINNTIIVMESTGYINKFYNYDNSQLVVCGNSSILQYATFSVSLFFNPDEYDNLGSRLKSKCYF